MKTSEFVLQRYDADDGMVFDWKETHYVDDEKKEVTHLHAKTIFLGVGDSIDNYIEVPAPKKEN